MKNYILGTMIGGIAVLAYISYKDGAMERFMKNIKPRLQLLIEDMKN